MKSSHQGDLFLYLHVWFWGDRKTTDGRQISNCELKLWATNTFWDLFFCPLHSGCPHPPTKATAIYSNCDGCVFAHVSCHNHSQSVHVLVYHCRFCVILVSTLFVWFTFAQAGAVTFFFFSVRLIQDSTTSIPGSCLTESQLSLNWVSAVSQYFLMILITYQYHQHYIQLGPLSPWPCVL